MAASGFEMAFWQMYSLLCASQGLFTCMQPQSAQMCLVSSTWKEKPDRYLHIHTQISICRHFALSVHRMQFVSMKA